MDANGRDRRQTKDAAAKPQSKSPSMHEDVETWTDCCSCEAEPRWQALADESDPDRRAGGAGDADTAK